MKSSSLSLPPSVRNAARRCWTAVAIREEFGVDELGRHVWRLTGDRGVVIYVKRAGDLAGERDRLVAGGPVAGAAGRGILSRVGRRLAHHARRARVPMYDPSIGWAPDRVANEAGRDPARSALHRLGRLSIRCQ